MSSRRSSSGLRDGSSSNSSGVGGSAGSSVVVSGSSLIDAPVPAARRERTSHLSGKRSPDSHFPMSLAAVRRRSAPRTTVDVGEVLGCASPGPPARTVVLRTSLWQPADLTTAVVDPLPMLVVEGAILRLVTLRGREGADLLGAGDLLRVDADDGLFGTRLRTLTPVRLAVLDDRVQAAAAEDPALVSALVEAAVRRASALASQVVLAQVVAIDDRLRVLFPALAER